MRIDAATLPILIALGVQIALGVAVFQANPKREPNQCFLLLSGAIILWLASLYFGVSTTRDAVADLSIRSASIAGVLILSAFNLLRSSITHQPTNWPYMIRTQRVWLACAAATILLCGTNFFLHRALVSHHLASEPALGPVPVYGNGILVYGVYFAAAGALVVYHYIRDVRITLGAARTELSFILIGVASTLGSVLILFALRYVVDPARLISLAPLRILLFSLVIAYGIATRRIMDVGVFLRRAISYFVLTVYLAALYGVVWWLVSRALAPFVEQGRPVAHIAAALVVAFAMAPARGVSQLLADRLFVGTRSFDFRTTISKATSVLASVTTLDDLLARFATTVSDAVDADHVSILLAGRNGYTTRYQSEQPPEVRQSLVLPTAGPIAGYILAHREPIILEELYRIRSTPQVSEVSERLRELKVAAAVGIFSRDQLTAIMLLGPRLSGRIYGSLEQNALQVLSGQLAVAIENAKLFTEVQNAKIYNDILLQNLTTGVIAADADGQVTVFNKEAEQITGLRREDVLDRSMEDLPESLRELLHETIASRAGKEHQEIVLRSHEGSTVIRASSSLFHDQQGGMLGGLLVFTDITALKRLELQIRRSDRLASLGTLSAGMAHEIKNPLVSIKTFAQLLPERYEDSDFRDTFSKLIGHEIDRIDSLVNQLLRFARPAKPLLRPMHVHEILDKSLLLVRHRLYQKEITLTCDWKADVDTIRADSDQIEQVFLNFFLNAMEAMNPGGQLTVRTQTGVSEDWAGALSGGDGDPREVLRISICDTGQGISAEDIPHVFDPFFTTKDYGTGLGLSVVHGIVDEHGGEIEVESELTKGTAFHILLPLTRFEQEVVAA